MTLLVRDEEDILEANICHHLNQGVDWIRVTDNGSVDGTVEILEKYKRMKYLDYTIESKHTYEQDKWVSRMAKLEIENGADYLIHSDADELWTAGRDASLKTLIGQVDSVGYVNVINYLPPPTKTILDFNFDNFKYIVSCPLKYPDSLYDMKSSKFLLYEYSPKVVTSNKFCKISYGNHFVKDVEMSEKQILRNLFIHHFPIRSYAHFEKKVINGGSSYEKNPLGDPNIGWHWKAWYVLYKKGELKKEYDRLCLKTNLLKLVDSGVVRESRVPRIIKYSTKIFPLTRLKKFFL